MVISTGSAKKRGRPWGSTKKKSRQQHPQRLDRVFKAETYYTRAYASYEKGAIENCNRLVRRWYPKGTDFNQLTRRQIQHLKDWINSIHRESLNGETAHAYDSRLAQAA